MLLRVIRTRKDLETGRATDEPYSALAEFSELDSYKLGGAMWTEEIRSWFLGFVGHCFLLSVNNEFQSHRRLNVVVRTAASLSFRKHNKACCATRRHGRNGNRGVGSAAGCLGHVMRVRRHFRERESVGFFTEPIAQRPRGKRAAARRKPVAACAASGTRADTNRNAAAHIGYVECGRTITSAKRSSDNSKERREGRAGDCCAIAKMPASRG
jgi:hypothetical protein